MILFEVSVNWDQNSKSQVWIFMQMKCLASYPKLKLLTTKQNIVKETNFEKMYDMPRPSL